MTTDYPTDEVPSTPEYVLAVLRYPLQFECNEGDLDFDTTLDVVAAMFDELSWRPTRTLAKSVSSLFAVEIPLPEWHAAFPKLWRSTVGDLCAFLAPRVKRRVIIPWRHIAGECLPAGAFLTVRSLLNQSGVNPEDINPASKLDPVLRRLHANNKLWEFLLTLARLAPARTPNPELEFGMLGGGDRALFFAIPLGLVGLIVLGIGATGLGCALLGLGCAMFPLAFLMGFLAGYRGPRSVSLNGLHTFRDLAYALAGEQPRRQRLSSAPQVNRGGLEPGTQA